MLLATAHLVISVSLKYDFSDQSAGTIWANLVPLISETPLRFQRRGIVQAITNVFSLHELSAYPVLELDSHTDYKHTSHLHV